MDPTHTGFTSSDSDTELERRAEPSPNSSFSSKFTQTSPLKLPGKGNSTIGLYGKNFEDYSYAAGYSTIKPTKTGELSQSVHVSPSQKKDARERAINSTLIGAKFARNAMDLTESINASPITPLNRRKRRTVPTNGSPLGTGHSPGHNEQVSADDSKDKGLPLDGNKSIGSSADSWVTVDDSIHSVKALSKVYSSQSHKLTPQVPVRVISEVPAPALEHVEEEAEVELEQEVDMQVETQAEEQQVPVAFSTPLIDKPLPYFETPPSRIASVRDSAELHPGSSSRFTLSMFDEMGSSVHSTHRRSSSGDSRTEASASGAMDHRDLNQKLKADDMEMEVAECEPVPGAMKTYPETIQGMPGTVNREPEVAGSEPQVADSEPQLAGSEPQVADSEPQVADSEPQVADSEPQVAGSKPQVADSEPQVADSEPEVADSEPQVADSEPQVADREPQVADSEHQVADSEAVVTHAEPDLSDPDYVTERVDSESSSTDSGPKTADGETGTADSETGTTDSELVLSGCDSESPDPDYGPDCVDHETSSTDTVRGSADTEHGSCDEEMFSSNGKSVTSGMCQQDKSVSHLTDSSASLQLSDYPLSIREELRATNERTPSKAIAEHDIHMGDLVHETRHRPEIERRARQRQLRFKSTSAASESRLSGPGHTPAKSVVKHVKTHGGKRKMFSVSSPLLVKPRLHTEQLSGITVCTPASRSKFSATSPILLNTVADYNTDAISSDSVTQDEMPPAISSYPEHAEQGLIAGCAKLADPLDILDGAPPLVTQPTQSPAGKVQSVKVRVDDEQVVKYPSYIQHQMDKMCLQFKKRHPRTHEETKHIPCDILTCSFKLWAPPK